jgi:hypothetical protein
MLCQAERRRNVRKRLGEFLGLFAGGADRTRRKFFRQAVGGAVMSGSLVVARWAKWVWDRCREPFYRQRRMLDQLHSTDWDHRPLLRGYQAWVGSLVQADTPLILDLTDLAKPRARKMKYLALVRDGSDDRSNGEPKRLVNGYWCVEVYARLGKKRVLPLVLHPYSVEDPAVLSENDQILKAAAEAREACGGRGVLVMDIGGDRGELLGPWVGQGAAFVVRMRGDRTVVLDNGARVPVRDLAEKLVREAGTDNPAWCRVYLPANPGKPLALVCRQRRGFDAPLMLLTSLAVPSAVQAGNVLLYYRQRWGCEEAVQFLKQGVGLERFAVRTYETFPRLFMIAAWAMAFLTWLLLECPRLVKKATGKRPGYRKVRFVYYRVLRFLQDLMFTLPTRRRARNPPTPARNG